MNKMKKMLEKNVEAVDISPFFNPRGKIIKISAPMGSGFSIKITQSTGKPPDVSVRTFGNVKREDIEKQLQNQLGVRPPAAVPKPVAVSESKERAFAAPKITEEPKTHVKRTGSAVEVDIELPGVKSKDDIEVREFENSVEVKAVAGDKAYFKILTKPEQFGVKSRKFEGGVLHLEFY
jgi:HSP20 family molecular chaperone IbpA